MVRKYPICNHMVERNISSLLKKMKMLVYYIGPMGFRSITYYLSNALICTVHILVAHFLYLYYTLISAYIKASICIVLFTKYNI